MQLRDYQTRAIEACRESIRSGKRAPLIVGATGFGKTMVASTIIKSHLEKDEAHRVAFFAHRRELVTQAASSLQRLGVEAGHSGVGASRRVQVVSVQTALARGEAPAGTLAVFDEAHHFAASEWSALPKLYANSFRLGLTATPERQDGRGLDFLFDDIIVAAQTRELIELGHLAEFDIVAPRVPLEKKIAKSPVDAYMEHGFGRSAVVFAHSLDAAREYATAFNTRGVRSEVVHGGMSNEDRDDVLGLFSRGVVRCVCNMHVLTEGFDSPIAKVAILARRFGSAGGYIQAVGRVLRPCGNLRATIIDLTGCNVAEYGAPDEERIYSLDGKAIRRKDDPDQFCRVHQVPRVDGVCPECGDRDVQAAVLGVANVELDKWAGVRALPESRRIMMLAAFLRAARDKKHKPASVAYKFKAIFKRWPSADEMRRAREACG